MFRKLPLALVLVLAAILVAAPAALAGNKVSGTMALDFNGPGNPVWVGTVTIDGTAYGMEFYNEGTGKPFDEDPNSSAHFFEETWVIYDGSEVVLSGYDRGMVSWKNDKYHMSGYVEVAEGPFAGLEGRNVYMRGTITWVGPGGPPDTAPGIFRVN